MRLYRKTNLSQRIVFSFLTIAIIIGIVCITSIKSIRKIAQNDKELYYNMTLPLETATEMSKLIERGQIDVLEMIAQNDTKKINSKLNDISIITNNLNELQEEFKNTIQSSDVQAAYDEYLIARSENSKHSNKFTALCAMNKDDEALAMFNGEMSVTYENLVQAMEKLVSMKVSDAEEKFNSNDSLASNFSIKMIIYTIITVLLAIFMGYTVSRLIGNPIKKLLNAANSIANGNLNIQLDIKSSSEIGQLAYAFDEMTQSLNSTISIINNASEQVSSGAKQVSLSSQALSQGSTEQASSIEQLSDSIKEITVQTNQSSEKRERAKTISTTALQNAEEGFSQMQKMVNAMNNIHDSSISISKIIKIIDEIAFQTNILALNAAVEAARAGEHGKGFAVVAEEVRNLAARSAEAAKETSELMENLESKVKGGNTIAAITSKSLTIIVETFSEIDTIIKNISIASAKQAISINQIHDGITEISDVVQSNSATSEQTASASEELSNQAEMLKNEISKFKL